MSQSESQCSNLDGDQDAEPPCFANLDDYLAVKTACYVDYHDAHHDDLPAKLRECAEYLHQWPGSRVIEEQWLAARDPEGVLETAVRCVQVLRHGDIGQC